MKKIIVVLLLLVAVSGCTMFDKPPAKIWWGNKGDAAAWEKARVVMENYNWVVISSDLEN